MSEEEAIYQIKQRIKMHELENTTSNENEREKQLLSYITKLEQENEKYKKIFDAKERFSKIMPEGTDFIILSKADYDRQQEDIELNAIELKSRIDKTIGYVEKYLHEHIIDDLPDEESKFEKENGIPIPNAKEELLNILQGKEN